MRIFKDMINIKNYKNMVDIDYNTVKYYTGLLYKDNLNNMEKMLENQNSRKDRNCDNLDNYIDICKKIEKITNQTSNTWLEKYLLYII